MINKDILERLTKKVMGKYNPSLVKFDVMIGFKRADGKIIKFPAKKIVDLKEYTQKAIKIGFKEGEKK